jgi:hypothetical protein
MLVMTCNVASVVERVRRKVYSCSKHQQHHVQLFIGLILKTSSYPSFKQSCNHVGQGDSRSSVSVHCQHTVLAAGRGICPVRCRHACCFGIQQ